MERGCRARDRVFHPKLTFRWETDRANKNASQVAGQCVVFFFYICQML